MYIYPKTKLEPEKGVLARPPVCKPILWHELKLGQPKTKNQRNEKQTPSDARPINLFK